jgi:hypothetical protein
MAQFQYVINPFTGEFDAVRKPATAVAATQAPKLIATFNTDLTTDVGDFVKVDGDNFVTAIADNSVSEMPNGVFGIVYSKPSSLVAEVLFVGIMAGFAGLTIGQPVFIDTLGVATHTPPSTGMSQQIGFAVSSTEVFINLMQPMRRS